jgi:hypothetical protein
MKAAVYNPLPEASVRFRTALIDALLRGHARENLIYNFDSDWASCPCPIYGGTLAVKFVARAPRAELECHCGCSEQEVLEALRRRS